MIALTKSTKSVKEKEIKREWYLFDAKDQILGRLVSKITPLLIGKNKSDYVPYLDMGNYVVVINAKLVKVTGKKEENKKYTSYSGYPSGLKIKTLNELREKKPTEIIRHAVWGMLPKNKLRDRRMKRLFVFPDEKHNFEGKSLKFVKIS